MTGLLNRLLDRIVGEARRFLCQFGVHKYTQRIETSTGPRVQCACGATDDPWDTRSHWSEYP